MPATGFFEMAAAAVSSLNDSSTAVLADLVILGPKLLPFGGSFDGSQLLACHVNSQAGALDISSTGMVAGIA